MLKHEYDKNLNCWDTKEPLSFPMALCFWLFDILLTFDDVVEEKQLYKLTLNHTTQQCY